MKLIGPLVSEKLFFSTGQPRYLKVQGNGKILRVIRSST